MNFYEVNKAAYNALPTMTPEQEEEGVKTLCSYIEKKQNTYYMMVNHDYRYFTLFRHTVPSAYIRAFAKEILDVAKSLGILKAVECSQDGNMIEIWITSTMADECSMYGFFGYDAGVIEV